MNTTVDNITIRQVMALCDEAGTHGDVGMVVICTSALSGDREALTECVKVIRHTEAQHEKG
jgi:hypothetical protein